MQNGIPHVTRSHSTHRTGAVPRVNLKSDLGLLGGAFGAFAVVVAALLVLVSVRTAQIRAGYRVHDLESEVLKLKQDRAALDVERATLLRPARLAELSRTTLGLVPVDATRLLAAAAVSP